MATALEGLRGIVKCLARLRGQTSGLRSPLIEAAASACGATTTQQYLQAPAQPLPGLPQELSDAFLRLHTRAKRARAVQQSAQAHVSAFAESTLRNTGPPVADAVVAPDLQVDHLAVRGAEAAPQQQQGLELALLLSGAVASMGNECDLLEAIVARVDLSTDSAKLQAYEEMLALQPFIDAGTFQSLVAM